MVLLALVVQLILVGCAKVKIAQESRETILDCLIIREPNEGLKNCYSTLSFFLHDPFFGGRKGIFKITFDFITFPMQHSTNLSTAAIHTQWIKVLNLFAISKNTDRR